MLNDAMDEVVLVKGWKKGANWSFPRGKINKDEKDLDCAIREVYEETGFDIREAGLVGKDEDMKFIEVTMREQHMRLYVFRGVPHDTHFEPRTRKEISKIQWYKLSELPTLKKNKNHQEGDGEDLAVNANKFYMVAPFLVPLKKWIAQQSKHDVLKGSYENQLAPTVVPQDKSTTETHVSQETNSEPLATDDMGRLMASLRQSGQAHGSSDLAEQPQTNGSREDAAAQLKNLLRLPQPDSTSAPMMPKTATADEAKSNALLALLRGGSKNSQTNAIQPAPPPPPLPHTPLEQISVTAVVPKSPSHHLPQPPRFSEMPPPPSFPLSDPPAQDRYTRSGQPTYSSHHHTDVVLQKPSGISQSLTRATGRYPITAPQPQRQQHVISTTRDGGHAPPFTAAMQARHQAPAPYRRTGDPEFVQALQNINNLPPSIPPASKLPPPKLTTHSSALLNIFKTGKPSGHVTKANPVQLPQSPASASSPAGPHTVGQTETIASQAAADRVRHLEGRKEIHQRITLPTTLPRRSSIGIASASPQSLPQPSQDGEKMVGGFFESGQDLNKNDLANTQSRGSVPRTQHQDALLSLFRKPSIPGTDVPGMQSTRLEPPLAPVELPAMPSPSHSRETSQVSNSIPVLSSQQSNNGHINIAKRPIAQQKRNKAPVSATVTGPLNLPHFEVARKKTKETKQVDGSLKQPGVSGGVQASGMTILSRPTNAQRLAPKAQPANAAPAAKTSGLRAHTSSPAAKTVVETKEAPKPFQPQILRRPPQPQPSPQPLPYETTAGRLTPPPPQSPPTQATAGRLASPSLPPPPQHRLPFDRRDSQPQEHKQALLSLFNKPSSVASPSVSVPTAIVSPLSDRTIRGENVVIALPIPSRPRIGSLTSVIGDGSVRLTSGKQTPRTAPVDRSFLLGYLEGVAKGDRR